MQDGGKVEKVELELRFAIKAGTFGAEPFGVRAMGAFAEHLHQVVARAMSEQFGGQPELVSLGVNWGGGRERRKPHAKRLSGDREVTKKDTILALLGSSEGTTMEEMRRATDWTTSTVSAQLTYLSKIGYRIQKIKDHDAKRYYLARSS